MSMKIFRFAGRLDRVHHDRGVRVQCDEHLPVSGIVDASANNMSCPAYIVRFTVHGQ